MGRARKILQGCVDRGDFPTGSSRTGASRSYARNGRRLVLVRVFCPPRYSGRFRARVRFGRDVRWRNLVLRDRYVEAFGPILESSVLSEVGWEVVHRDRQMVNHWLGWSQTGPTRKMSATLA